MQDSQDSIKIDLVKSQNCPKPKVTLLNGSQQQTTWNVTISSA